MTANELREMVNEVRRRRSELDNVEVKSARRGTPRRLYEALSAFANRPGGGVLLFGVDESSDFSTVGVGTPHRLQEDVTNLASSDMEPALRPTFTVCDIDGNTVVTAEIDEVPVGQKPCFYKAAGLPKGAYLRVGNTNRQMTDYEVFGYLSSRGQPQYDEEVIPDAALSDLDRGLVDAYLNRLQTARPRAAYLDGPQEDVHIVENRGSGIKAMLHALREANLEPPAFDDRRSSFQVAFHNHTLMNPDAIAWLNQFAAQPLNDRQRLALVYLRQHERINNADYRRLNRVDPTTAGSELRGLTETELVEQEGVGRWTSYRLKVSPELPEQREPLTDKDRIVAHVREKGAISNAGCRELLGVNENRAYYLLKVLCDEGRLAPTGAGKGRRYTLP
jgi:predicted HTH transcriptional regulator